MLAPSLYEAMLRSLGWVVTLASCRHGPPGRRRYGEEAHFQSSPPCGFPHTLKGNENGGWIVTPASCPSQVAKRGVAEAEASRSGCEAS